MAKSRDSFFRKTVPVKIRLISPQLHEEAGASYKVTTRVPAEDRFKVASGKYSDSAS